MWATSGIGYSGSPYLMFGIVVISGQKSVIKRLEVMCKVIVLLILYMFLWYLKCNNSYAQIAFHY